MAAYKWLLIGSPVEILGHYWDVTLPHWAVGDLARSHYTRLSVGAMALRGCTTSSEGENVVTAYFLLPICPQDSGSHKG